MPGGLEALAARAVAAAGPGDACPPPHLHQPRDRRGPGRGGVRDLHRRPGVGRGGAAPRAAAGAAHHRHRPAAPGRLAVAAGRGQDDQLRGQHGRRADGQGPRRRRRRAGRARRRAAGGADGQPLVPERPHPPTPRRSTSASWPASPGPSCATSPPASASRSWRASSPPTTWPPPTRSSCPARPGRSCPWSRSTAPRSPTAAPARPPSTSKPPSASWPPPGLPEPGPARSGARSYR